MKPKPDLKEILNLHRAATEQKREPGLPPWVFVFLLVLAVYSLLFVGLLSGGPYVGLGPAQHLFGQ